MWSGLLLHLIEIFKWPTLNVYFYSRNKHTVTYLWIKVKYSQLTRTKSNMNHWLLVNIFAERFSLNWVHCPPRQSDCAVKYERKKHKFPIAWPLRYFPVISSKTLTLKNSLLKSLVRSIKIRRLGPMTPVHCVVVARLGVLKLS